MKFSTSFLALCLGTLAVGESLSFFGSSSQKALGDDLSIPGDNPLKYCKDEHGDDILKLDHVNLTPNPPTPYVSLHSLLLL